MVAAHSSTSLSDVDVVLQPRTTVTHYSDYSLKMRGSREEANRNHAPTAETLRVKRLVKGARLPSRITKGSVGYDVFALMDFEIPPGSVAQVGTGIAATPPEGTYLRVASKSGLAVNNVHVCAGVIDQDYTGEIRVLLENRSRRDTFKLLEGQAMAQLILERISLARVEEVQRLPRSNRGGYGLGAMDDARQDGERCAGVRQGLRAKQPLAAKSVLHAPGTIHWTFPGDRGDQGPKGRGKQGPLWVTQRLKEEPASERRRSRASETRSVTDSEGQSGRDASSLPDEPSDASGGGDQ